MIQHTPNGWTLLGDHGQLVIPEHDHITPKLAMLYEVQCEGQRVIDTVKKFQYSKQRYYQLLNLFLQHGASALQNQKRGQACTPACPPARRSRPALRRRG